MTDKGTPTPQSALIREPSLVSPDSGMITPAQYLDDLFGKALDHQRLTYPAMGVQVFEAEQVPNWYKKPDPTYRPTREVSAFYTGPFVDVPTDLTGGFIAETPAGYLGVALHRGNEPFQNHTTLKLEYGTANERETPWLFTQNPPQTLLDLRAILYATGAQTRPTGQFEVDENNRLVVRDPTVNYPGVIADVLSEEGQRKWLSEEGKTEGVAAIQRLVDLIARHRVLPR
ncbi:MAG: hypothetical protein HY430_00095 [Candidatus Levybacteria bacterium]|nr:hypothetical protein [Candidatus Levybacteria bacterium]